jgi:hypothetical protein
MFLIQNRQRGADRNNSRSQVGSALIAVMGLVTVGLLVVLLAASVLTSAFTVSSITRAEVQAQAAAEGGVAVALAALNSKGNCELANGVYSRVTTPAYRATIWRSTDGLNWSQACPNSSTKQIRIISTGTASDLGVIATSGDVRIVEAIFGYGPDAPGPPTAGSAMYVYAAGYLDTYEVLSTGGRSSDVSIRTGDYACTGPTLIEGSVTVAAGDADLTNTCIVQKTVFASGAISLTTYSQVLGDVISSGAGVTISNSTVVVGGSVYANGSMTNHGDINQSVNATGAISLVVGSNVGGNVWSGLSVAISAPVGGSVTTPGPASFTSTARVTGDVTIGGILTYGKLKNAEAAAALTSQGIVQGTISYLVPGIASPIAKEAPIVADWVDVAYTYSEWQDAGFTQEIAWPSQFGCRLGDSDSTLPGGDLYPFYQQLKNLNTPTVIDARSCTSVNGDIELSLKTDVAFIANNFNYDVVRITSADGESHRIWFIVPDVQPTVLGPQCVRHSSSFTINTPSSIGENVVAMAYAPCSIAINNGTVWRGQLYSGSMNGGGGTRQLYFIPIGVPGSDVGGGTTPPTTYSVGELISQRNRSDSGE